MFKCDVLKLKTSYFQLTGHSTLFSWQNISSLYSVPGCAAVHSLLFFVSAVFRSKFHSNVVANFDHSRGMTAFRSQTKRIAQQVTEGRCVTFAWGGWERGMEEDKMALLFPPQESVTFWRKRCRWVLLLRIACHMKKRKKNDRFLLQRIRTTSHDIDRMMVKKRVASWQRKREERMFHDSSNLN